jgi:type VI secretion system protein ImpK
MADDRLLRNAGDEASVTKTWLRRSLDKIIPSAPAAPRGPATALRGIFTDLIAYVLFFQATCGEKELSMSEVRDKIVGLIADQERRVKTGEAPWEAYREALFAVLSWVDEAILTSAWRHRGQWRHLMLTSFGTLNAGEQFFQRMDALPPEARDVREVYYLCLNLGFQGHHAIEEKPGALRDLRKRVYRRLVRSPEEIRQRYPRLFPDSYRKPTIAAGRVLRAVHPVWFAVVLLVPAALFATYTVLLRREVDRALVRMERRVEPPPAVRQRLVDVLRARGLQAEQTPRGVVITLPSVSFEVNSADLSPDGARKIADVAAALKDHARAEPIVVEGHASRERATPESTNQRLSDDRARNVKETLVQAGLSRDRVTDIGYGSRRPAVPDRVEDPRNRRVEVIVEGVRN